MSFKIRINLKERGTPKLVPRDECLKAGCINDIAALSQLGAVKVTHANEHLLIEPKNLVGVFDSARLRLEVKSKTPELSSGLIKIITGWRKKINVADPSKNGELSDAEGLWKRFEILLLDVHREGLPWSYRIHEHNSSTPRGRILFRESMNRLASKGISHQLIFNAQTREFFEDFAPLLDAVRRRIISMEEGLPSNRSKVFQLINLVGDLSKPISIGDAQIAIKKLTALEGRPALKTLCKFCAEIIDASETFHISQNIGSGVAEFIDLEKLWESAVQMLLEQHIQSAAERVLAHPLRGKKLTLFNDGGPTIDPDIITYRGALQYAVVDAKYIIASTPSADDVYQLCAYQSRLKCDIGIIAYVSENAQAEVQKIGTLSDGSQLFACFLTLDAFNAHGRILREIFSSSKPITEMA